MRSPMFMFLAFMLFLMSLLLVSTVAFAGWGTTWGEDGYHAAEQHHLDVDTVPVTQRLNTLLMDCVQAENQSQVVCAAAICEGLEEHCELHGSQWEPVIVDVVGSWCDSFGGDWQCDPTG